MCLLYSMIYGKTSACARFVGLFALICKNKHVKPEGFCADVIGVSGRKNTLFHPRSCKNNHKNLYRYFCNQTRRHFAFQTLPPAPNGETRFRLRLRGGRRFTPPERLAIFNSKTLYREPLKSRIFVPWQGRRIPGGAKCIKTYMSIARDEPDAARGQKDNF